MSAYTISQVEHLTGIKAHVLRYWEENVPLLSPQKDMGGRRTYSLRDIQLIMRLKYLVHERKFTLDGAAKQIIYEAAQSGNSELMQKIILLKNDLIEIYRIVKT